MTDLEQTADRPVLAAHAWPTNADLIADVARLGYLRAEWVTLDPTFGRGIWWKKWRPDELVAHDLAIDGVDFRDLPYADDTFDAVAFDPPYIAPGGRATSTLGAIRRGPVTERIDNGRGPKRRTREGSDFHDRYGLVDAPKTPAGVQELLEQGLAEVGRVVKPGGVVLVKCQDYITSGRLWLGTHRTLSHALELGFDVVDRLEHVAGVRPQPGNRTRKHTACNGAGCDAEECDDGRVPSGQQHARRNLSTLFVFRAPIRRRAR